MPLYRTVVGLDGKQKTVELSPAEIEEKTRVDAIHAKEWSVCLAAKSKRAEREALIDKMLSERPDAPEWMKRNI
jgi:hypothetical protein